MAATQRLFVCAIVALLMSHVLASTTSTTTVGGIDRPDYQTDYVETGKNAGFSGKVNSKGVFHLTVTKDTHARVTDVDRMLFMEMREVEGGAAHDDHYFFDEMSKEDVSSMLELVLGTDWATMVDLPRENLNYLEYLRLSASLNEYTRRGKVNGKGGGPRAPQVALDCICHLSNSDIYVGNSVLKRGTRLLRPGNGHFKAESNHGDCVLCDHNDVIGGNCPYCCNGICAEEKATPTTNSLPKCNAAIPFNYVGAVCEAPVSYTCSQYVLSRCTDCDALIAATSETCGCQDYVAAFCDDCSDVFIASQDEEGLNCGCTDVFDHLAPKLYANSLIPAEPLPTCVEAS